MLNQTITSLSIRTNGDPVAVCPYDKDRNPIYCNLGLISLTPIIPVRTYQMNCLGFKPFSLRGLESVSQTELSNEVTRLNKSEIDTEFFTALNNGRGLQVYFNNIYAGMLSFGKRFDKRTIWMPETRKEIKIDYIGDIELKRYSPDVKNDFQLIVDHLESRRIEDNLKRRAG